jgi:hypothetical protein
MRNNRIMATQVADLLGGERVLGTIGRSNLEVAHATLEGLPAQTALELAEQFVTGGASKPRPQRRGATPSPAQSARVTPETLAVMGSLRVLDSAPSSGAAGRLTPIQSDAVFRIASALAKAIDVLGNKKKGVHWLQSPNRALGSEVPLKLLDTSAGSHEVEALLDRIEYGVYS